MPKPVSDSLKCSRSARQQKARKSLIKADNTKIENLALSENSQNKYPEIKSI